MPKGDLTITLNKAELMAVNNWLSQMDKVDQTSSVTDALRQGIKIIQTQGKANLASRNNVVSGNLKKSFALSVNKKKAYAISGFRRSAPKKGVKGGNHAHLVDLGTAKRWTKKGAYRGSVSRGNPNTGSGFWTDAVASQGPHAVDRLMEAVYKSLEEITRRNQH